MFLSGTQKSPLGALLFLLLALVVVVVPSLLLLLQLQNGAPTTAAGTSRRTSPGAPPHPALPVWDDTLEMARLSQAVYDYRHDDPPTAAEVPVGCPHGTTRTGHRPTTADDNDWECHWYHHHEWYHGGIQVMMVTSKRHNHVTIVFAGTDDVSTMLLDTDARYTAFGDGGNWTLASDRHHQPRPDPATSSKDTWADDDSLYRNVRVHAGFNYQVFGNGVMDLILPQLQAVRQQYPTRRVFVTGHSLGAAAAILTSMALTEYYDQDGAHASVARAHSPWWDPSSWWRRRHHKHDTHPTLPPPPPKHIYSINFGCPRVGNAVYRTYFPNHKQRLHVWRVVLGWDLVPRLPDFFWHAGHTIQISEPAAATTDPAPSRNVTAYYEHYGNDALGYAGVPSGWAARPYIWVPGALESHHIANYVHVLQNWTSPWVTDFARVVPTPPSNATDDDDDDDANVHPPWDDFPLPQED